MKSKTILGFALAAVMAASCGNAPAEETYQWKPVGDKIMTDWAAKVDPSNVLPEYPRPQLQRPQWQILNGLWDYAVFLVILVLNNSTTVCFVYRTLHRIGDSVGVHNYLTL